MWNFWINEGVYQNIECVPALSQIQKTCFLRSIILYVSWLSQYRVGILLDHMLMFIHYIFDTPTLHFAMPYLLTQWHGTQYGICVQHIFIQSNSRVIKISKDERRSFSSRWRIWIIKHFFAVVYMICYVFDNLWRL